MVKELVSLAIGQCGLQMSHAAWELICLEHGISTNGQENGLKDNDPENTESVDTFFNETKSGSRVPRAVMIDTEPTVMDEIRTGAYRNLHHPENLINCNEDAANNFARGLYTIGKTMVEPTTNQIRRLVEDTDSFQGFFFVNGLGGGTGSGFTSILAERLNTVFGKSVKLMLNVIPGPTLSTAVTEPYNTVLATHMSIEHSDINLTVDNEAIYNVCKNILSIPSPFYKEVNQILAQCISNLTCSLRFRNTLNADINQLQTNIVPYPRIHFPAINISPFISENVAKYSDSSVVRMTKELFEPQNKLVSCDLAKGRYIASCIQYRGMVSPKDVNMGLNAVKAQGRVQFVDWCPTGFKVGISLRPPMSPLDGPLGQIDSSSCMISNNTGIVDVFRTVSNKFHQLKSKNAFVHWYVSEGMEEGELDNAFNVTQTLINDYTEVGAENFDNGNITPLESQTPNNDLSRNNFEDADADVDADADADADAEHEQAQSTAAAVNDQSEAAFSISKNEPSKSAAPQSASHVSNVSQINENNLRHRYLF